MNHAFSLPDRLRGRLQQLLQDWVPLAPARELLGDLLMELDRPREALEAEVRALRALGVRISVARFGSGVQPVAAAVLGGALLEQPEDGAPVNPALLSGRRR